MARPRVVVPLFLAVVRGDAGRGLLAPAVGRRAVRGGRPAAGVRRPGRLGPGLGRVSRTAGPTATRTSYADEVRAARARIADRRELRRAVEQGAQAGARRRRPSGGTPTGCGSPRPGTRPGRRRTWEAVARAFGGGGRAVGEAGADGLAELARRPPPTARCAAETERAKKLRDAGHPAAMDALADPLPGRPGGAGTDPPVKGFVGAATVRERSAQHFFTVAAPTDTHRRPSLPIPPAAGERPGPRPPGRPSRPTRPAAAGPWRWPRRPPARWPRSTPPAPSRSAPCRPCSGRPPPSRSPSPCRSRPTGRSSCRSVGAVMSGTGTWTTSSPASFTHRRDGASSLRDTSTSSPFRRSQSRSSADPGMGQGGEARLIDPRESGGHGVHPTHPAAGGESPHSRRWPTGLRDGGRGRQPPGGVDARLRPRPAAGAPLRSATHWRTT